MLPQTQPAIVADPPGQDIKLRTHPGLLTPGHLSVWEGRSLLRAQVTSRPRKGSTALQDEEVPSTRDGGVER